MADSPRRERRRGARRYSTPSWSCGIDRYKQEPKDAEEALAELLERAVTEFAPIADPASLARILARQARRAKADLPERFDSVAGLLEDYRTALGLTFDLETEKGAEFFRSSLIQTAYYGLFAGWTLWHRAQDGTAFQWAQMDNYLKVPFLGKLFYEFKHPDRLAELRLAKHLDRAAATLGRVDHGTFFARFAYTTLKQLRPDEERSNAARTYFYEPFLEAFDPDLRKELGVWYTPPEIVRYQVRKVDRLLRQELECARGFADPRVVVLDPCCGTAAYLLEVARCIAENIRDRGDEAVLAAELLEALSSRVIGFEILTAPFVVAQLQLYHALLDPALSSEETVRRAFGKGAAMIGVSRRRQGGQVAEQDLVVSIAYFGGARGKWVERAYAEGEQQHAVLGETTGDLYINDDVYFANVPKAVWRYELGGYPVLKKWLGYRQASRRNGQPLTLVERHHFRSMIRRIAALLALHQAADALYEKAAAAAFTAEELGVRV